MRDHVFGADEHESFLFNAELCAGKRKTPIKVLICRCYRSSIAAVERPGVFSPFDW